METEKLIAMANQIGDFFEAYPSDAEAIQGIANHLHSFWNSVMIHSIVAHVAQHQGAGLHPRVADAIKQHLA
ncbi:MAG: formate dehydrogenase subunit delta [Methylophilaceae bacterium]|nr:formate dehydrogenase subunit delta [Methylophilaceae bacterium]MDG2293113.1 formate dehydrogenase subunit delta [Methylophilaceae bacterium]